MRLPAQGRSGLLELGEVDRGHHPDQPIGLGLGVPERRRCGASSTRSANTCCAAAGLAVATRSVALSGARRRRPGQADGRARWGTVATIAAGMAMRLVDRDDEHPLARLRHEQRRVDHHDAEAIARVGERVADGVEILAAVRGDQAGDVLDHDHLGRPALGTQALHKTPERPEGAGARPVEAGPITGEADVLTREARPRRASAAPGKSDSVVRSRDIADFEAVVTEIGGVAARLAGVDVVGEGASPLRAKPFTGHSSAAEELKEGLGHHDRSPSWSLLGASGRYFR